MASSNTPVGPPVRPIATIDGAAEGPPDVTLRALIGGIRARGVEFQLRGNRLRWFPFDGVTAEELSLLRQNRERVKDLIRAGLPPPVPTLPKRTTTPPPIPEADPVVFAYDHLVTESDVRDALTLLGDDTLVAYDRGRLSKVDAYDIARRHQMQLMELKCRRR